jgi:predicted GIY-YIG superfamily endonuclease
MILSRGWGIMPGLLEGWYVYLLECQRTRRTYIGSTNNFTRRFRQHNGDLKGGAKYTTMTNNGLPGQWAVRMLVHFPSSGSVKGTPFVDKQAHTNALKFEYRMKRAKTKAGKWASVGGTDRRRERAYELMRDPDVGSTTKHIVLDAYLCPETAAVFSPSVCNGQGYLDHILHSV